MRAPAISSHAAEQHLLPHRVYFIVWAALVTLTAVTVGVTALDLGKLAKFTAILIASVKASLVLLYFMHLRFETRLVRTVAIVAICTFAVFLFLTFADYLYR